MFNLPAVKSGSPVDAYEPDVHAYAVAMRVLPTSGCTLHNRGLRDIPRPGTKPEA